MPKKPGPVVSAEPFTSGEVLALLQNRVLKGDARLPGSTDRAIVRLTKRLNVLRRKIQDWDGPSRAALQQRWNMAEAIRIMAEVVPAQREDYVKDTALFEPWETTDGAAKAQAYLAAFDALISAACAARKCGFPLAVDPGTVSPLPPKQWQHFAQELADGFKLLLPDRSNAAAYRFVCEITPYITGEHPTFLAVESQLKKKRHVNRGKRMG